MIIKGVVCRVESKDYYVYREGDGKIIRCYLRGKFKKEFELKKDKLYKTDIAVVGDVVEFELNKDGSGIIRKIHNRTNYVSRKAPRIKGAGSRGERLEQVIVSNIDNLFIVSSVSEPQFNNKVIDRLIVAGESSRLQTFIIINKIDLDKNAEIFFWQQLYSDLGYKVFMTSVPQRSGLDHLKKSLKDRKNLFWGQSGVGKSSMLNSLYPQLNLTIGEISSFSSKGKHTTVTSSMIKVEDNTFIIDTPGLREIDPYGIKKEDLGHFFIDFSEHLHKCKFNTCTHHHEPGCAVIDAVERGEIYSERYESYLRILKTIEEDILF